tara:strand:- start:896 stop:3220 length:2325 start_codon:yes stop_codon:yes gene_type:complete
MRNYSIFLLLIFFFFYNQKVLGQVEKKPKIAVVLSGGGAKGIAHIPLLQKLDSLNIVPDLVVGTSMGSLVGGFYAMGYSGDSIASITKNANWDKLLGGKTSLRDVSVEEKSEFGKYLVDFDIKKGKIKTKVSILNDQHLREFFMTYTNPVYNVAHFEKLPIPYRAIATDIVNGEEVVLKEGSLALAMRASMSIPSIFEPVPYNDVLLVDGGILNNFPVDVAKKWGADIIIGSDVSGGMLTKKELEGITPVLFQAAMLVSNKKNPKSRNMCDILIDHYPNLTYSTGDFNDHKEIYKEGLIATNKQLEELIELSNKLKSYKQRELSLPETNQNIVLDTIVYKGISKSNIDLVKSRSKIVPNKSYTVQEIVKGIDRTMGTTLFNQIDAKPIIEDNLLGLEITGHEKSNHRLRTSFHCDDYRGLGLVLNYTGRNILGKSSRILITGDIAKQPRFRIQYQKQLGKDKSWWWRNEVFGEFLNQEFYIGGVYSDEFNFDYVQFDNQINKNLESLKSYVGIGLNYDSFSLKPRINLNASDNLFGFKNYRFQNIFTDVHFVYNNLSNFFYAKKGALLKSKILRSLENRLDYISSNNSIALNNESLNRFTKVSLSYEKRVPLHKSTSVIISGSTNLTFIDKSSSNKLPFDTYGIGANYFLGGYLRSPRENSLAFPGLNENALPASQVIKFHLKFQTNPFHNFYISPHLNYASIGFGQFNEYIKDVFLPKGNWSESFETSSLFSFGTTVSYNSILGPINIDVSFVNDIGKVQSYFGAGLFLNLSD